MATGAEIEALIEQVNRISEGLDKFSSQSNQQVIIHKQAGPGGLLAAAITACILTWCGLIVLAVIMIPEIHDLRAWKDVHAAKIAVLEGKNK